ncbi:hypothetical protein PG993_011662 [Apiospora rasikravindrae]|uniref:Uncharacterized protein n=1 Tax=Apiospora rasikravindrae TaxID=990691 RepID=A0ABR1S094_9PEZI
MPEKHDEDGVEDSFNSATGKLLANARRKERRWLSCSKNDLATRSEHSLHGGGEHVARAGLDQSWAWEVVVREIVTSVYTNKVTRINCLPYTMPQSGPGVGRYIPMR